MSRDVDTMPRQAAAGQDGSSPDTATAGLYGRFLVQRMDRSTRHAGCDYFVLDLTDDPHAARALAAYAASCAVERPALAADLHRLLDRHAERGRAAAQHDLAGTSGPGGPR